LIGRNWTAALGLCWLGAITAPAAAAEAPVLRTAQEVFRQGEPILVYVEHAPTNVWDRLVIAETGSPNVTRGPTVYLKDQAPGPEWRDRWYVLPAQPPGDHELRLYLRNGFAVGARLPLQVSASGDAGAATIVTPVFADQLIEFAAAGQSRYQEPFGHVEGPYRPGPVDPAIVLGDPGPGPFNSGNPKLEFLTLPKGSSVTVGFTKHVLVDRPGPDFFVRGVDLDESAGEVAEVEVSSDLTTFHLVDRIMAAGRQPLDLAGLALAAPVRAIRVVGGDLRGAYPGFELVSVELASALPAEQAAAAGEQAPRAPAAPAGGGAQPGKGGGSAAPVR